MPQGLAAPPDGRAVSTPRRDPAAIAREGVSVTKPVIVRIPPNGREIHQNQWMVKQILDTGVAGLMFPHIETAEQAINAIKAVRYPQPPGSPNMEPEGVRGASNSIAARFWGMASRDYELRSDVWGLRPGADMLGAAGTLNPGCAPIGTVPRFALPGALPISST